MAEHIGGINSIHDVDCRLEAMWPGSFTEHVRTRFGPEESKGPREGAGGSAPFEMDGDFQRAIRGRGVMSMRGRAECRLG